MVDILLLPTTMFELWRDREALFYLDDVKGLCRIIERALIKKIETGN